MTMNSKPDEPLFKLPASAVALWTDDYVGPPVVCATCRQKFKALFETQSYGCASDVLVDDASGAKRIISHYGSGYDTFCHHLSPSSLLKPGIVCDACITYERSAGRAVFDESFDYFEYAGWNQYKVK